MSHFSVAVFHRPDQSVEELLAPYDEGKEVEKYVRYTRQEAIDYVRKTFEKMADKPDEECWEYLADDYDEAMKDGDGNLYSTYNRQSRWDWYETGGRWKGMLRLLVGGVCDSARVRDCDFSPDMKRYKDALRFWDVVVEGVPMVEGEGIWTFYKPKYYREQYGSKENYAMHIAGFSTYAFVTPDGEWHETGKMGWWGMDDAKAESREAYKKAFEVFLKEADQQDLMITIVDCHI